MASADLACRHDPERWFDRHDRVHALQGCLSCPVRPWCATEALRSRPSHGMWAGIWIDDNLDAVSHYLHVVASGPRCRQRAHPHVPRHRGPTPPPFDAAAPRAHDLIVARASGHCEVLTPYCRFGIDNLRSRTPQHEISDPSGGYAVCRNCEQVLADVDEAISHRLGYLVGPGQQWTVAPFYWRQARSVVFTRVGGLVEAERVFGPVASTASHLVEASDIPHRPSRPAQASFGGKRAACPSTAPLPRRPDTARAEPVPSKIKRTHVAAARVSSVT